MALQIKPFYTVAEVARLLQVTRWTVYRMIERGDLETDMIRGRRMITLSGLQAKVSMWESIAMAESWRKG